MRQGTRFAVTVILIFVSVMALSKGLMDHRYYYIKRGTYAYGHLNLAIRALDAQTVVSEINRFKVLTEDYPRTGNYMLFKNPVGYLENAWATIDSVRGFATEVTKFTDPFEVNHGMEEIRVKLQAFHDQQYNALVAYDRWVRGGIWFWVFWLFEALAIIFYWITGEDREKFSEVEMAEMALPYDEFVELGKQRRAARHLNRVTIASTLTALWVGTLIFMTFPLLYGGPI